MTKIRFGFVMFVIALIFGIMVFGCDIDGNGNSSGNVALNGEWTGTEKVEWSVGPHWRFCYNYMFGEGCEFPLCNDCIYIDKTESGYSEIEHKIILTNDGIFRMSRGGFPYMKGTYSTGSDRITINPSHYSGWDFHFGLMVWMDSSNTPWYNKNEFKTEWIQTNDEFPSNDQLELITNFVNDLFGSSISNYSMKGNVLTIMNWVYSIGDDKKQTFTRKNE